MVNKYMVEYEREGRSVRERGERVRSPFHLALITCGRWETWSNFLPTAVLERAVPVPHLGNTVKLTLFTGVSMCRYRKAGPEDLRTREPALLLAAYSIGWAIRGNTGELTLVLRMRKNWQADQPSNHADPEPRLWVVPFNNPPLCDLLEHGKGQTR